MKEPASANQGTIVLQDIRQLTAAEFISQVEQGKSITRDAVPKDYPKAVQFLGPLVELDNAQILRILPPT